VSIATVEVNIDSEKDLIKKFKVENIPGIIWRKWNVVVPYGG